MSHIITEILKIKIYWVKKIKIITLKIQEKINSNSNSNSNSNIFKN
jgi:hypothetical protein